MVSILKKAFTLVELMVVVAILSILAMIGSVHFGKQLKSAQDGKAVAILGSWRSVNKLYYIDNQAYAQNFLEMKNSADSNLITNTFSTITGSAFDGAVVQWTRTGTATLRNEKMVSFELEGVGTSEVAINFQSANGQDTKGKDWNKY